MVGLLEVSSTVLQNAINNAIQKVVMDVLSIIPGIIAAIIVLIVGWIVAVVISWFLRVVLEAIGLEVLLKKYKLSNALGGIVVSNVLVKLTKYYVILLFLQAAFDLIELGAISSFIRIMLIYAPAVIGAALLVLVSALFGELVKDRIVDLHLKSVFLKSIGSFAKAVIIFIGIVMGLGTMGFNIGILEKAFIVILQGLIYGVALAVAISFGLGGQEEARNAIKTWKKKVEKL
jgi:hypothetical protein